MTPPLAFPSSESLRGVKTWYILFLTPQNFPDVQVLETRKDVAPSQNYAWVVAIHFLSIDGTLSASEG
jgi:hypothetical protein